VFGDDCYRSLAAIGKPIDLAVIATPAKAVAGILDDASGAGLKAALLLTAAPNGDPPSMRRWNLDIAECARRNGVRLLGPHAYGLVRSDIALNATFSDIPALPGRLAVISQSGAVCTALLDFATPLRIGFSSVVTVGEGLDVDVPELLDVLVQDATTDAILLYMDEVRDARGLLSALRAAARVKPVVILKAGSSLEARALPMQPSPDEVFSVAMRRAGTVRVQTYAQLFAAARALAIGRIPQGDRVAIIANGRGPALLAADRAVTIGVKLATLAAPTLARLEQLLPGESMRGNPLDLRGDATVAGYGDATRTVLADAEVDAVVVLNVPRPSASPEAAARAVADIARAARKPVLAAWLGSVDRRDVSATLEAGGVANFYTPENAIEAFAFLASYRRNQAALLEVPAWQDEPSPPDLDTAERIRAAHLHPALSMLDSRATAALLAAFGIARDADGTLALLSVRSGKGFECAIGVHIDETFGPVITLGGGARFPFAPSVSALPPLNHRLASALVAASAADEVIAGNATAREALVRLLLQVSALVSALPWVRHLQLDPLLVDDGRVGVLDAAVAVDTQRAAATRYAHMAIHPYPAELATDVRLPDGARIHLRPIRPEDAVLEQRFVAGLSGETRYYRFFYQLNELTPQMLVRFTQVDYDRELALVALVDDPAAPNFRDFAGIARFIRALDRTSAEFAIVVGDAWQRRGLGRILMEHLVSAARAQDVHVLEGTVLRENSGMLRFVESLGFTTQVDPGDSEQMQVRLVLARQTSDTQKNAPANRGADMR
jgi:acetyltransferase